MSADYPFVHDRRSNGTERGRGRCRRGAAVKGSRLAVDVQVVIAPTPGTVYVPHSIDARIGREQKPVPPAENNEEAR